MMFKTIDTFSLEKCKEYLATNPNSKCAFDVVKRMECLMKSEITKDDNNFVQNDFVKKFNRLFATKRYSEAFLLCVNSTANPLLSSCARDKGEFVMPFLQKKGVINVPDNTS